MILNESIFKNLCLNSNMKTILIFLNTYFYQNIYFKLSNKIRLNKLIYFFKLKIKIKHNKFYLLLDFTL